MYKAFNLPYDFLNREYTQAEKDTFEDGIANFLDGTLQEELTAKQKAIVDSWNSHSFEVREAHKAVFGDRDRITEPLIRDETPITHSDLSSIKTIGLNSPLQAHHNNVINHLEKHGYMVTDYIKGLAKKQYEIKRNGEGEVYASNPVDDKREYSIGKVLAATGGNSALTPIRSKVKYKFNPETGSHVKDENGNKIVTHPSKQLTVAQAYAADPIRAASKGGLHVTFTRNKYDVAGCSTDRGWNSCMNMEDGSNKHYLKHDIHHGTITAYLTHKDDEGITNPIGRINLKKFEPVGGGKIIYRPETSSYGTVPKEFRQHVQAWAEKNYPMHENTVAYNKNSSLYNDDGKNTLYNDKHKVSLENHDKIHKILENHYTDAISAADDAQYAHNEKYGYGFHDENHIHAPLAVDNLLQKILPENRDRADYAFHAIKKISEDTDGEVQSHDEVHRIIGNTEISKSERADWLHAHHVLGWDREKNLNDSQLTHHVKVYNAAFGDKDSDHYDEDKYHMARNAHYDLISEALSRPHLKDVHEDILHHYADNPEYHSTLNNTIGHPIHDTGENPITKTQNPRLIHKIITQEGNGAHYSPYKTLSEHLENKDVMHHVGKHADEKLMNHVSEEYAFMHPKDFNGEYSNNGKNGLDSFVKGLNENKNGKNLQHIHINRLYLHGGSSEYGGLNPIKDMRKSYDHNGNLRDFGENNIQMARVRDVMSGSDGYLRAPGTNDDAQNRLFHSIASESTHQSVLDNITKREDLPSNVKEMAEDQKRYLTKRPSVVAESISMLKKYENPLAKFRK